MGSRIWRTILTPKLGIAVAVIIAFAVGAYLSGTYLNPFAQASHVAANSGPTSPHSVKARGTSSLKTKHAVKSKRAHSSKLKPKHKHKPTPKADPSPHPTTPGSLAARTLFARFTGAVEPADLLIASAEAGYLGRSWQRVV